MEEVSNRANIYTDNENPDQGGSVQYTGVKKQVHNTGKNLWDNFIQAVDAEGNNQHKGNSRKILRQYLVIGYLHDLSQSKCRGIQPLHET